MKIVSLVPSITETLLDLGGSEVVGRTKFCIHPRGLVNDIPIVGGTKNLHLEKIRELQPEVIIANKEENEKTQIEELQKDFRVWITDINTVEDHYDFILNVGSLVRQPEKAKEYCLQSQNIFQEHHLENPMKVAYLIWKKPWMAVGNQTFIHDVLNTLGFKNIFEKSIRYPEIDLEDLAAADTIMLSTEPFPFADKHAVELRKLFPEKKIIIVDGEAFSWYGTHLAKCGDYYSKLLESL